MTVAVAEGAPAFFGIYAIVDAALTEEPVSLLEAILGAGIDLVQYRAKAGVERAVLRRMLQLTRERGARLIVNDDFEAALEADGWHAGQEDLAFHDVGTLRSRLGERVFGVSCGTPDEARLAAAAGADYLGVGPFAATGSKSDAGPAIGVAGVRAVVQATALPVAAIGGIDLERLAGVVESGASMAAVISALARAPEPGRAAAALVLRWQELAGARAAR